MEMNNGVDKNTTLYELLINSEICGINLSHVNICEAIF